MIQTIKMEHCYDSKDGVQNGCQVGSEDLFDQHTQ